MANPYDTGLDKNAANYQPLTPLVFLERAASVHPHHTAVIHGYDFWGNMFALAAGRLAPSRGPSSRW